MNGTVSAFLQRAAERWPDRIGLIERGAEGRRALTHRDLHASALRGAARLRSAGVAPGDRVALVAANGVDLVAAWFAIIYAGGTVIPISTVSAPPEIAHRLGHARCKAIVHDGLRRALARRAIEASGANAAALSVEDVARTDSHPLAQPEPCDAASPAMILYTSGTTGRAKGAVIAHGSLVRHTRDLVEQALRLGEDDRVLGVLPLAHSYGCRMVMLASLHAGCPVVLESRFDAARALTAMTDERVTWVPAVPTMFAAWGALPDGPRPPALRWCLAAGSPLADEVLRRAEARLGAEIRQAYGMTEATISTLDTPPDERVAGCVGRPAPGVEVRIADADDGAVPAGSTGQILLRGPNLMSGYLDDPAATADALRGGWMHSGDVGRIDEHGRLWVVDRLKDMIIRGGNNVYPSEVEAALASHPDVVEVAVVGRPDTYLGEEVVAVVVPRASAAPSAEELRDWAAARVSGPKVPREYAIVAELPLGPSRKVLKRTLREQLAQGTLLTAKPTKRK